MNEHTTLATQTAPLEHDTHREHLAITISWLQMFGSVGIASVLITTALGIAATVAAPWWILLPLLTMFTFAAIGAMITLRSLEYARYALHQRFESWLDSQEAAREIAKAQANQLANVQIKGSRNTVTVGPMTQDTRIIPLRMSGKHVEGVPVEDLAYFCTRAPIIGISKRAWLGQTLPSGRICNTWEIYDQMLQPMLKAGLIVDRAERSAGKLTTSDSAAMMRTLGIEPGETVRDVTPDGGEPST